MIIAGGRDFGDMLWLRHAIESSPFEITEIVSGDGPGTPGADKLAIWYANANDIPLKRFPPDWKLGKYAGPKRNREMAKYGQALIALPGGKGTADMLAAALEHGLPIYSPGRKPDGWNWRSSSTPKLP